MSETVVALDGLAVSYGSKPALRGVSFEMSSQSGIVGLFGPNGAGKSTTLRVMVGDIARYRGRISVPLREHVAYLPDKPFLYRWLRVSQCVDLFARRHQDFRPDVCDAFLSASGVLPSARVASLSKGMSEQLHLALVMARNPRLYVLDEPLAAVDPLTRDRLIQLITTLRAENAPVLLSTHLIHGLDQIFDSVVMIAEGRALISAPLESVRALGDGDLETAYKRIVSNHE